MILLKTLTISWIFLHTLLVLSDPALNFTGCVV
jgi:hypothetical protein